MRKAKWLLMLMFLCVCGICLTETKSEALTCWDGYCCCDNGDMVCNAICSSTRELACYLENNNKDRACCWLKDGGSRESDCKAELAKSKSGHVFILY